MKYVKCVNFKYLMKSSGETLDQFPVNDRLVAKLKIVKDDSANHSLPSDLKALINDEKSADVVVEAGGKEFKVHR